MIERGFREGGNLLKIYQASI